MSKHYCMRCEVCLEELADLRRRLRLAARKLDAWCADKDPGGLVDAAMLLDRRYSLPRKPLPRGRR